MVGASDASSTNVRKCIGMPITNSLLQPPRSGGSATPILLHDCGMLLGDASMRQLKMSRVFTLIEPGPVVLVTTCDENKNNIMTISWTMVLDFTPAFAITTGAWYYSFAALQRTRECVIAIPTVDLLDQVVGIGTCFPQLGGYASTKYA